MTRSKPREPRSTSTVRKPARAKTAAQPQGVYTIVQLAESAGTTVRNVRAYQDRGLIPPPQRVGRIAHYNDEHLGRLRVIQQMLGRGHTLASIAELFEALESGHDVADLIGLQRAVSSPWTDETPKTYTLNELFTMFGNQFSPKWLMIATDLGVLEQVGARFRAPSPKMIHAGAQLVAAGIPLDEMLAVVRKLRQNVETAADDMVCLVEKYCFDRYGPGLPPPDKVPELARLVWRLRPLVEMAVQAEVARAMEMAANKHLGDRLSQVLASLSPEERPTASDAVDQD